MNDLDDLAARLEGEGVTVPELLACVSRAAAEMGMAIEAHNNELGVRASSALLNSLALLPMGMREGIAEACLDRAQMHPRLQRLAL